MKLNCTLAYEVEARLIREETMQLIVVDNVEVLEGETPFFPQRSLEQIADAGVGFEGLDSGHVLDVLDLDEDQLTQSDEEILDAYFNSPYGVA